MDIDPQAAYPFTFIQADALTLDPFFVAGFDAIHASPPCQHYSDLAKRNGNADDWPDLVADTRIMLQKTGKPWVMENVEGSPLISPVCLCGTMFPGLRVIRHRLFESNFPIRQPHHKPHIEHPLCHTFDKRKRHYGKTDEWKDYVSVNGGGNCTIAAARDAMGIDWMNKREINEAIPPAYTAYVGAELLRHLEGSAFAEDRIEGEDTPLLEIACR